MLQNGVWPLQLAGGVLATDYLKKTTSNSFLPAPINNDPQAKLVASQAHLVLPSDVASLVFLYEMGDGKDSWEKNGVMYCGTTSSLPGTEMLTVVPLKYSSWYFDWFCLKDDKCPAPLKTSNPCKPEWSYWRGATSGGEFSDNEKSFLKPCAIYWSSRVNYSHDSPSKKCNLAFVIALTQSQVAGPILKFQSSPCAVLVRVIVQWLQSGKTEDFFNYFSVPVSWILSA